MTIEDRVAQLASALQVTEAQVAEAVPRHNYKERELLCHKLDELLFDLREWWKLGGVARPGGLDE